MHPKTRKPHTPRGLQTPNTVKHRLQAADQNNSKPTTNMDERHTAPGPTFWTIGNHSL